MKKCLLSYIIVDPRGLGVEDHLLEIMWLGSDLTFNPSG